MIDRPFGGVVRKRHPQARASKAEPKMDGPVVVVGLPRSGSTLLCRILNDSDELLVVNDFYYLQRVEVIEAFGKLAQEQRTELVDFILARLECRSRNDGVRSLVESLLLSQDDLSALRDRAREFAQSDEANWASLLEDLLSGAAYLEHKKMWGWNTPQDYLHLNRLREAFPESRFLFLIRDPYAMLASYKNVRDAGNDPHRYNPVVQALHWKLCVQTAVSELNAGQGNVLLIRYEDLVSDTDTVLASISRFLGVRIPSLDLQALGSNSSFRIGPGRPVTPTEQWLCDRVIGRLRQEVGYGRQTGTLRLRDWAEVTRVGWQSLVFHLKGIVTSKDSRRRARNVVRRLVRRNGTKAGYHRAGP